jgi:predicted RNA-binding protein YlqC (UPF0109 family)
MKNLLDFLLNLATGTKEGYEIVESNDNGNLIYIIKADKEIIGQIIGKSGRTIKAIKNLLMVKSKGQDSFMLNVEERE